jgi:hypothetical protein
MDFDNNEPDAPMDVSGRDNGRPRHYTAPRQVPESTLLVHAYTIGRVLKPFMAAMQKFEGSKAVRMNKSDSERKRERRAGDNTPIPRVQDYATDVLERLLSEKVDADMTERYPSIYADYRKDAVKKKNVTSLTEISRLMTDLGPDANPMTVQYAAIKEHLQFAGGERNAETLRLGFRLLGRDRDDAWVSGQKSGDIRSLGEQGGYDHVNHCNPLMTYQAKQDIDEFKKKINQAKSDGTPIVARRRRIGPTRRPAVPKTAAASGIETKPAEDTVAGPPAAILYDVGLLFKEMREIIRKNARNPKIADLPLYVRDEASDAYVPNPRAKPKELRTVTTLTTAIQVALDGLTIMRRTCESGHQSAASFLVKGRGTKRRRA